MKKFVPYDKLSKKKKAERDREKRGNWGTVNPVTRFPKSSKAYDRPSEKRHMRAEERCW